MAIPRKNVISASILLIFSGCVIGYLILDYAARVRLPQVFGEQVEITDFSYSLWKRSVHFDNPSFRLDSGQNDAKVNIDASATQAYISGFSLWELLSNQELSVDTLAMDELRIDVSIPGHHPGLQEKKQINLFIQEVFTRISVDHFKLSRSTFELSKRSNQKIISVDGLFIAADQIATDTATIQNVFPLTFGRSEVTIDHVDIRLDDDYRLYAKNVLIRDTSFQVEDLQLEPVFSRSAFVQKHPYEKVQFHLLIKKIMGHQILWDTEQDGRVWVSSTRTIFEQPEIHLFKDKRSPIPPLETKPLLDQLIKNLPFGITIDTLRVMGGTITYEQQPVEFPQSGKVTFDHLYLTAYHLSNKSDYLAKYPELAFDVKCAFMGKAELNVHITMDMLSTRGAFQASGRLGEMPFTYLNQAIAPLTGVQATGNLQRLTFQFRGDTYSSSGSLDVEYTNLKVNVFDKQRKEEWIKSTLGNLALNSKNLKKDGSSYRSGEVYFVRYQNKGFFNYLWNSLRVGLLDVAVPFYQNPDKRTPREEPKMKMD